MTDSQNINQPRSAQGCNRNILHLLEHVAHKADLLVVIRFKQHSPRLAFYSVDGQDVDLKHPEHGGDVSKEPGPILMYLVFHVPLFVFQLVHLVL
ncbi:hypothetical protein D3C71_1726130 [compost metagenome]